MHERKALMAKLSDAFVALPGGYGTFDELCEMVRGRIRSVLLESLMVMVAEKECVPPRAAGNGLLATAKVSVYCSPGVVAMICEMEAPEVLPLPPPVRSSH